MQRRKCSLEVDVKSRTAQQPVEGIKLEITLAHLTELARNAVMETMLLNENDMTQYTFEQGFETGAEVAIEVFATLIETLEKK